MIAPILSDRANAFKSLLALSRSSTLGRLMSDLRATLGMRQWSDFIRFVEIYAGHQSVTDTSESLRLLRLIASSAPERWQDWAELERVLEAPPPAPPAPDVPATLPKGIGGATCDRMLDNVRAFLAAYVDGGDLEQAGRDILRTVIDHNVGGPWKNPLESIGSVTYGVGRDGKARVAVRWKTGSECYYYGNEG